MAIRLRQAAAALTVAYGLLIPAGSAAPQEPGGGGESGAAEKNARHEPPIDPLGPNAACYICHMTFVGESISKVHLAEKIGCVQCHGVSAEHANDEHIGATPPDVVWKRGEVDRACGRCHPSHDAPAREVIARFLQRRLRFGSPPVCTDCHGRHRIAAAADSP